MKLFYTLCCWCLAAFSMDSMAQDRPAQVLNNYNSENGLPQNSAKSLTVDKNGYLWVATEMGLVRFDGSQFRTFNHNNTPQLAYDRIQKTGLLNDQSFYCLDEKGNMYRFNAALQLEQVGEGSNKEQLTSSAEYGPLSLQRLWKDAANKRLEKMVKARLPGYTIFLASSDSTSGFLLFGSNRYIAYLSGYTMRWIDSIDNYKNRDSCTTGSYQGRFYYVNDQQKLCMIDSSGSRKNMTVLPAHPVKGPLTAPPVIRRLFQTKGKLFGQVGEEIWDLSKIDDNTFAGKPVVNIKNLPDFLGYLNSEQAGIQVIGHATKGLFIARKNPFQVVRPPAGTSSVMYSQSPVQGTSVLTYAGVLPAGPYQLPIPPDQIFRLSTFRDNRQHNWLIRRDTLLELDQQLNTVRKIIINTGPIQCFQQTTDGAIWITVNEYRRHQSRLGKIVGDSVEWKHTNPNQLYNETFLALTDHLFWLGNKNGLQEIDLQKGTVKNFPLFEKADVRSIYKDRKGIIWIGTYSNGFYAMHNGRFTKLPSDRKGYLNTTHTFLEDRKGFMWMPTNRGLFQIQMNDLYAYLRDSTINLYYQYYDDTDGLPTNEFNGGCNPAGIIFEDGKFSLPSMDGLVQFYPDSIIPRQPDNKLYIDEIWIDSTRVTDLSAINLPPSFNRFSISISSPYFGNPYNQSIEYNLQGLDDKWYPVNENNTIIFNRLNHGKYQLQLRKKAGFGTDNFLITHLPVTVQAGFFNTWTFKILLALLAGLLFYVFVKFRYRYLVRKKRLLEQEVAVRTTDQVQLIGELQSTVKELKDSREELDYNNRFKEKLALLITHDLQSPLRFLSIMAGQLHEKAASQHDPEIRNSSAEIKHASQEIHSFVEEFGLWATTQQENFRINTTRFYLQPLMEELQRFFKEMLMGQGNVLITEIDPSIKLHTDRQLLKIILRNLIDNANKHTRNGIIRVRLENNNNTGNIIVHDNGRGMPPKELEKIHARILQSSKAAILDKDGRLGYQVIVDFVSRLGAVLSLQSSPETGTSVFISNIECVQSEVENPKTMGNGQ